MIWLILILPLTGMLILGCVEFHALFISDDPPTHF